MNQPRQIVHSLLAYTRGLETGGGRRWRQKRMDGRRIQEWEKESLSSHLSPANNASSVLYRAVE